MASATKPEPRREIVYLGLGANLGERASTIAAAVAWLRDRGHVVEAHLSPLYETDAVADHPQPRYLNAVLRGQTPDAPLALLGACLAAEVALGRVRPVGIVKAARLIDIDILLYGRRVVSTPTLRVPHPGLLERPFVLVPLRDVAEPGLVHPVTGTPLDSRALEDAREGASKEESPGVSRWVG